MLFIHANTCVAGGGRHVQMTRSLDEHGLYWSPFQVLQIDGLPSGCEGVNIYFFDVDVTEEHVLTARFPAVIRHPSGRFQSGIFQSTSHDGVSWVHPRLIRATTAYEDRTTLHPVGLHHLMRINLHIHVYTTELLYANESHSYEFDSSGS